MRIGLRTGWVLLFALGCGSAPPAPSDEAGFVDVPPRLDAAYDARLFYSFREADVENAPVAIFFNGGPGFATSFGLLPWGTGPFAIDLSTRAVLPNPASWTSFANLLYVDERQSGFSYGLGGTPEMAGCTFDPVADAADFVRVLIHFLDAHPALTARPVVFVAESYGGMRATYALDLLLRYSTEASRVDGSLEGEIQAHYDRVFPERAGTVVDPATAATQFGRVVYLEPFILGQAQTNEQAKLEPLDPYVGTVDVTKDPYDVRQPVTFTGGLTDSVGAALASADGARELLGAEPGSIADLLPAARTNAFRSPAFPADRPTVVAFEASLVSSLGALGASDAYVHTFGVACTDTSAPFQSPSGAGSELVAIAPFVRMFLTRARFDAAIYSPALLAALTDAGHADVADAMHLAEYDASGHMIEVSEPQKLHDDVAAWVTQP